MTVSGYRNESANANKNKQLLPCAFQFINTFVFDGKHDVSFGTVFPTLVQDAFLEIGPKIGCAKVYML